MFAVAMDNRARTRSRGYVATISTDQHLVYTLGFYKSSKVYFDGANIPTATTPAPAPAVKRSGVERVSWSDHVDKTLLNAPYDFNAA